MVNRVPQPGVGARAIPCQAMESVPGLGLPDSRPAARQWLGQQASLPSPVTLRLERSGFDPTLDASGTEIVVADCVLWAWTQMDLERLAGLVADRSLRLLFLEPTSGLGWRERVQTAARPWWHRRYGHSFERDIPAELRSHGLTVTTTIRFREGLVRHYVVGEARHFPHLNPAPQ